MAGRISRAYIVVLLAACASTGCKSSSDAKKAPATATDPAQRCERLGKTCGDNDKHAEKIATGCKDALSDHGGKGCTDQELAAYDCYEKELCGKADKIWAVDDLRVLAERTKKCAAERDALAACLGK